ncbi:TonB-dependent receptor [Shewanella sp.]|uniref:TonB-dependent receptor n=1 Tax=Shewanella sp. TaxID=50422 RepID=UPI003568009C
MLKNSILAKSVRFALVAGAASSAFALPAVYAAEDGEKVERIQITGSAIKRTDLEGALPVQVIDAAEIAKSGVTSVPDLIASLPSMQGFVAEGESVGGGGGGVQTASLRDLGAEYTLVLVNGRRQVSSDSGGSVDINSIPLAAIKRVEILSDGASALYGSDAIAGVVNFILKDDVQETTVSARYSKPQDTSSYNFNITTGFGDISTDGFNIMASYNHDGKDSLKASDRDFAKTGMVEFEHAGQQLIAISGSSNAIPGNAYVTYNVRDADGNLVIVDGKQKTGTYALNPYKEMTGSCHETSGPSGNACQFDYTSTLEIQPESTRDNFLLQGVFAVTDSMEVYASATYSKFDMTSRIAPYPTGTFSLGANSDLVQDYVIPYLPSDWEDANGISQDVAGDATKYAARWRVLPGGNRTNEYSTVTKQFVVGVTGEVADWSYDFAINKGDATREDNRITGYPLDAEFRALLASGDLNVFLAPEDMSAEQNKAVKDTMYNGNWDTTDTGLFTVEGKASGVIAEMPAGDVYLGVGFDYREQEYSVSISEANEQELIFLDGKGDEFDLSRNMYGAFAEVIVPVAENFEVTGSLRYDHIGATKDDMRAGEKTVGDSQADTTYKLSASYRPTDEWLFRASYGTGFKAPTMRQIAEPRVEFGVTATAYDCPEGLPAEKAQYCYTDKLQYDVYREGNGDLKPEKSTQYTVGFVWSGDSGTSFGVDYWNVEMQDQVSRLTQNQIFFEADRYSDLFVTKTDKGTGDTILAIVQAPDNIGKSKTSGIDWSFDFSNELSFGTWNTNVQGTYMIESKNLRIGTTDVWDTSMGKVGPNEAVTFRNQIRIANTLTMGDLTQSLYVNYRSGYQDAAADVAFYVAQAADWDEAVDGSLVQKHVPHYFTIDYRMSYALGDSANLIFGIKNLLDEEPPFTLNAAAGHQVGYDPRYADPYGRTFYVQADYKF